MIDYIHSVLGEYKSSHAHTQIQRPNQTIISKDTGATRPFISDVPDLISVDGHLHSSPIVSAGASLSVRFRSGPPFPGTTPFIWTISGDKSVLRITSERGPFLQSEASELPVLIDLHDFETGEVRRIDWQWADWQEPEWKRSRNIATLYEIFYEGESEVRKFGLADFGGAVGRHAQLDEMLYTD